MRITSKGQVTIPVHIRKRAGFNPNVEVEFVWEDGKVVLKAADGLSRGERMVARLSGSGTANLHMTTDEIMELMRGPYENLDDTPVSGLHESQRRYKPE